MTADLSFHIVYVVRTYVVFGKMFSNMASWQIHDLLEQLVLIISSELNRNLHMQGREAYRGASGDFGPMPGILLSKCWKV